MRTLFEISRSGLQNAEWSLSATSQNLINANTPGYSRVRVDNSPIGGKSYGMSVGLGVSITSITRLRDEMTDLQIHSKKHSMGFLSEKARIFEQLQAGLSTDSGGDLDVYISRLFGSFSELSNDPQDQSVRNNLISQARQFTDKMSELSSHIGRTSEIARDSAINSISEINKLLEDLGALNKTISQSVAAGRPDYSQLDIQVQKLDQLSQLVDFDLIKNDNGSTDIRIGGIQVLSNETPSFLKPELDEINQQFRVRLPGGKLLNPTGGKLGASIELYQKNIPELRSQLNAIASTVVEEFNALHRAGFGLDDGASRNFFDPDYTTADTLRLNTDITTNPRHIAASTVEGEAGNGDMATMIADLRNKLVMGGQKLIEGVIGFISSPGAQLSDVRNTLQVRESEVRMLEVQQERVAGVNIDEELSNLIKYQNAYQGAARVMSAGQNMYDTLLSILR